MVNSERLQALQVVDADDDAKAVAKRLLQTLVNIELMRPMDANRPDIVVLVADRLRPYFAQQAP